MPSQLKGCCQAWPVSGGTGSQGPGVLRSGAVKGKTACLGPGLHPSHKAVPCICCVASGNLLSHSVPAFLHLQQRSVTSDLRVVSANCGNGPSWAQPCVRDLGPSLGAASLRRPRKASFVFMDEELRSERAGSSPRGQWQAPALPVSGTVLSSVSLWPQSLEPCCLILPCDAGRGRDGIAGALGKLF